MVRGKDSRLWWHTASIMATVANVNRGKNSRPIKPAELHPYVRSKHAAGMPVTRETMGAMVTLFVAPEKAKATAERLAAEKLLTEQMTAEQLRRLTA